MEIVTKAQIRAAFPERFLTVGDFVTVKFDGFCPTYCGKIIEVLDLKIIGTMYRVSFEGDFIKRVNPCQIVSFTEGKQKC